MWNVSKIYMAWLILYLIANSLAFIVMTLIVWWTVLITESKFEWMCEIKEMTLFLMLASAITMTELRSKREFSTILLSFQRWAFLFSLSLQFAKWKEKWSGKLLINPKPDKSFFIKRIKRRKNSIKTIVGIYNRTLDF